MRATLAWHPLVVGTRLSLCLSAELLTILHAAFPFHFRTIHRRCYQQSIVQVVLSFSNDHASRTGYQLVVVSLSVERCVHCCVCSERRRVLPHSAERYDVELWVRSVQLRSPPFIAAVCFRTQVPTSAWLANIFPRLSSAGLCAAASRALMRKRCGAHCHQVLSAAAGCAWHLLATKPRTRSSWIACAGQGHTASWARPAVLAQGYVFK